MFFGAFFLPTISAAADQWQPLVSMRVFAAPWRLKTTGNLIHAKTENLVQTQVLGHLAAEITITSAYKCTIFCGSASKKKYPAKICKNLFFPWRPCHFSGLLAPSRACGGSQGDHPTPVERWRRRQGAGAAGADQCHLSTLVRFYRICLKN